MLQPYTYDPKVGNPITVDVAGIPEDTIQRLINRTLSHILGNEEQAARINAKNANGADFDDAAFADKWRADKVAQIMAGELGFRATGPRKDPVEVEFEDQVRIDLRANLLKIGVAKVPMRPKDGHEFDFGPHGKRLWGEMFEKWSVTHRDRLMKQAESVVRARMREAEKVAKAPTVSFEELGL